MNKAVQKLSEAVRNEAAKRVEKFNALQDSLENRSLRELVEHFHNNALNATLAEIKADKKAVWPDSDSRLQALVLEHWMERYHGKFSFLRPEDCSPVVIQELHKDVFSLGEDDDLIDFLRFSLQK